MTGAASLDGVRVIDVLFYDRCNQGAARLNKNSQMIKSLDLLTAQSENVLALNLDEVNRPEPFPGQRDARTLLLDENRSFPDIVVIQGNSPGSGTVLDDAVFMCKYRGLDTKRIIYLHEGASYLNNLDQLEVTEFSSHGGNGHLDQEDAKKLVETICKIVNQ